MRRFTRLTNAFSKKPRNHGATVAVYFMYYNFARGHQTLRVSPRWKRRGRITSIEEIVGLLDRPPEVAAVSERNDGRQAGRMVGGLRV